MNFFSFLRKLYENRKWWHFFFLKMFNHSIMGILLREFKNQKHHLIRSMIPRYKLNFMDILLIFYNAQ